MTADRTPPVTGPTPPDGDVTGQLAAVLSEHEADDAFTCACGWHEFGGSHPRHVAAELAEAVRALMDEHAAKAEQRGYDRGRRDFQFEPSGDNHHNAALCPYCSPDRARALTAEHTTQETTT